MRNVDNGGPAFPTQLHDNPAYVQVFPSEGMSLRDWFAGQALIGLIMRGDWFMIHDPVTDGEEAKRHDAQGSAMAYRVADAMIAARDK